MNKSRPARVARHKRHVHSHRVTPIPSHVRQDVEVWETWSRGGGKPETFKITVYLFCPDDSQDWYLSRQGDASTGFVTKEIRYLCDALTTMESAPAQYHDALKSLCEQGQVDQALEIARSMTGGDL